MRLWRTAGRSAAILVVLWAATATARLIVPGDDEPGGGVPTGVEPVLGRLAAAIEAGDHEALADLIHPDGVQLALGPVEDRTNELTPAQAFYYFKTLLQGRRTLRFSFQKRQSTGDDRLLAAATWRFERTDDGSTVRRRLLFTLTRGAEGWRVTEITALRGR